MIILLGQLQRKMELGLLIQDLDPCQQRKEDDHANPDSKTGTRMERRGDCQGGANFQKIKFPTSVLMALTLTPM